MSNPQGSLSEAEILEGLAEIVEEVAGIDPKT